MIKIKPDIKYLKVFASVFLLWLIPLRVAGQTLKGRLVSAETGDAIAWADVVLKGRNSGTVTDGSGCFEFSVTEIGTNDSLRFSMLGFGSITMSALLFAEEPRIEVCLAPVLTNLQEVKIFYSKPRVTILGTRVPDNDLRSGFGYNDLGSELGIKLHLKKSVKLEDINLDIGVCTYDSVTYRLNIYQAINQSDYRNILNVPIYISFSGDSIENTISLNLRKYSIIVSGNIIVALELYRNMGEGSLLFRTSLYGGKTIHRKSIDGTWTESPGVVGLWLHGLEIR